LGIRAAKDPPSILIKHSIINHGRKQYGQSLGRTEKEIGRASIVNTRGIAEHA